MSAFDEWWEKNENQYSVDAFHMSEYHMASVAFNAGMTLAAEICREIYKSKTISTLTETIKTVAIRECHDAIIKARDGGK